MKNSNNLKKNRELMSKNDKKVQIKAQTVCLEYSVPKNKVFFPQNKSDFLLRRYLIVNRPPV